MIKLSLECYQTTRHHHVISQPIPFIAHPVSELILPHIQSHPSFKQFQTVPPRCAIHHIKKPLWIQLIQAIKNFVYLDQIRPKKSCFQRR